ncbi:cytoplasmic protein [Desulfoluna sp.]|uniref:cytoplasmic protein n=1 Tax=Desulfoluna sp. TaxID=2045199 RepID=UPI002611E9DB|nr:cytoplasmic protein [Desulfoluna sp.]
MSKHTYRFVEEYSGAAMYGWDLEGDIETLKYNLQKFSDDSFLDLILGKLDQEDRDAIYTLLTSLLKKHLTETEYHRCFLKDGTH